MAILKTEWTHVSVTTCPDCGHDVFPLYTQIRRIPSPREQHGCLVAADGSDTDVCGCDSALHHLT